MDPTDRPAAGYGGGVTEQPMIAPGDEDAIRAACRDHLFTLVPGAPVGGASRNEPVDFLIGCSCGGLHMSGNAGEVLQYFQAHLRAHGIPVSMWWPSLHPDHPRFEGRS